MTENANKNIIDLNSWEEFEKKFQFPSKMELMRKVVTVGGPTNILYRGQSDATWKLETTLQRLGDEINYDYLFIDYVKKAVSICGIVDTYTNSNWNLDNGDITFQTFEELLDVSKGDYKTKKRIIEYLIFLRHQGFPSPLLDWCKSPYIAAFFAFGEIPKGAERAAIYEYNEMPYEFKYVPDDNSSKIDTLDYAFRTHKRHYLQQTSYTICLKNYGKSQGFGTYEDALEASTEYNVFSNGTHRQDLLMKYTLPVSERKKVLRKLDNMNINEFSLFETNEALMKTLVLREIVLLKD
jgi:hypothetical protein